MKARARGLVDVGDRRDAAGHRILEDRCGKDRIGQRRDVDLPRRQQRGGLRCAARERHLQCVVLAVPLEHVLLHPIEEYDCFDLVRTDATSGRIANELRRGFRAPRAPSQQASATEPVCRAEATAPTATFSKNCVMHIDFLQWTQA